MKALPKDLIEKIDVARKTMSDQLDESVANFDHKLIANICDRVNDEIGGTIQRAVTEMGNLPIPGSGKAAAFLNITSTAVQAAVGLMAMGTMSREDLRKTHSPNEMTRDHMLFAALFAVANETITDEGKRAVVEMASKFAAGDQKSLPGAVAHHWFDMIRGYRFKSSGVCAA